MGVILQRMVSATVAGVAFGRNPVNPVQDELVIEAVSGSGERLVNGQVSPHRAFISNSGDIRFESPAENNPHLIKDNELPMLKNDWLRIADLLKQLQLATGEKPLDIEWAIDASGQSWLLQYRRITTGSENDLSKPLGIWTRRIADDLWADRLTPFMAHTMVNNAHRFNLSRSLRILNIPVVEPSLSVIDGYLYVNCEALRQVVAFVPSRFRTADIKAFFPEEFDYDSIPKPGMINVVTTAIRSLMVPVLEPAVNPLICLKLTRRHWKRLERRIEQSNQFPITNLKDLGRKLQYSTETMTLLQENNQWPYFHAAFFTMLLRWITVDQCGASHAYFLSLISSGGNNISIAIERHFRKMAAMILEDANLTILFQTSDPQEVIEKIPTNVKNMLKQFLDRYGCRSRHRTLYVQRWAESPTEVIGILQALVNQSGRNHRSSFHGLEEIDRSKYLQNEHTLSKQNGAKLHVQKQGAISRVKFFCRITQPAVKKMARQFLDLREDLRFLLDKALYEIRTTLLQLGEVSGLGEDIMFLDSKEIDQLINGYLAINHACDMAGERRRRFLHPIPATTFYIDGQPAEELSFSSTVLKGIGTSPGRVSGRVRIVSDPSQDTIQKGDILVAQNTDPGWTPILSLVAGMIMEEGGLLNHCSIVARELRIPAIVGIRQATLIIQDGAQVTMDGGLGWVRVEEN
jgi:pyruvate,water dikinase